MPVKQHNNMLSKQFLLSTMRPEHPNHMDLDTTYPRLMRPTLISKFRAAVKPLAPDGTIGEPEYKHELKKIHTGAEPDHHRSTPQRKPSPEEPETPSPNSDQVTAANQTHIYPE